MRTYEVEPFYNNLINVVGTVKNERVKQNSNIFRIKWTITVLLRLLENISSYNLCGYVFISDIGVSFQTPNNVVPQFRGTGYENVFKLLRADWACTVRIPSWQEII